MSNTSTSNDKTVGDDAKVKLIIGEIGRDTKTGIIGRGYSFDNGRTFHVTDTIFGRLYDDRDADGIWNNGMHEKVKEKVNQEITNTVEPAIKQADSAVAYANDAIEKSRVNSQAIVDINSAVSDAVSDAAVARSDGLRAWDAAQSNADLIDLNYASASAAISSARTEAIAAADEAKASASAAQADIVAVRSDVAAVQADVTANKSDVAVAKSDIAVVKTNLASQAKSLSSYAAQASAAGKDITVLKSQAGQFEQDMADTKGDVSQLKVSASSASVALSDAAGNISSLQASAKSYSAALSDTNSNVASVTATASELETKYADAAGDISQLQTDAKGTAQTLADAQGDIAKLKIRADGFDTEFASTNGDINKLQTDASGTKQTLTNAKNDIAVLQSRADGFDTKYADVAGDINKLQVDASGMKQTLTDAQGNISTLQATATGFKNTLTDAQGNISTLQSDVAGLKKTTSDHAGNIATLQANAKTLTSQMSSAQGDISTLQQTASGFSSKVSGMETSLANANSKIDGITSNGGGRNLALGTGTEYTMGYGIPNTTWEDGYAYLKLPTNVINRETLPQDPHTFFHTLTKGTTYTQTIWFETDAKLINSSGIQITWFTGAGHDPQPATLINLGENKYKLYSTYMWPGKSNNSVRLFDTWYLDYAFDLSTGTYFKFGKLMLETGTVAHDWQPAPEDTDAKITANTTAIDQNKKAIALKADQTTVDTLKGTVNQNTATLATQANQIQTKVSASDVSGMLTGYATQTYTQSLVTQKAGTISESIVKLDQTVKQGAENNVQLVRKSDFEDDDKGGWSAQAVVATDPPAELGQSGMKVLQTNVRDDYEDGIWYSVKPGEKFDVDFWCKPSTAYPSNLGLAFADKDHTNWNWQGIVTDQSDQWKHYTGTITAPANASFAKPWFQMDKDASNTTDTALLAKPSIRRQNATTVAAIQQITASIDGLQSNVTNFKNDTSSQITQLSNLIATKVSSSDFDNLSKTVNLQTLDSADINSMRTSGHYFVHNLANTPIQGWVYVDVVGNGNDRIRQDVYWDQDNQHFYRRWNGSKWTAWSKGATESEIIQLSDDINIRVKKGDVVSQINQEAGGNTLIQVSGGKGKLALNASSVIFSGSAFIPDAYITTLNADKLRFYDSSGNVATMSANLVQHDDDKVARTINLQYNGGYEVHASNTLGSILTMHDDTIRLAVKSSGSSGDQYSGVYAMTHYTQLSNYRSDGSAPGVFIYDDQFNILGDANGAGTSKGDMHISSPQLYLNGSSKLQAGGDHALLTIASDYTTIHADKNVWMETGNTQLHLDNSNNLEIANKNNTNTSNYDVHLTVRGWATFTGWVNCLGLTQTSRLSTKTNIERLDTARALELINSADVATYQYKQDVANGGTKRHASVIIDDVNDVARYQTPDEFISEDRSGRNDGDIVGYLIGAVQELTKKIKTLESKVG